MVGDSGNIWLYDITAGKLLKVDYRNLHMQPGPIMKQEIMLPAACKNIKSPCLVNDSTFMGTSYMHDDCRYLYFSATGHILAKCGVLPPNRGSWPRENDSGAIKIATMTHPANCLYNRTLQSTCIYYATMPDLEIYRHDSLVAIVRGPEVFDPLYKFKESTGGMVAVAQPETRFAYADAKSDDRYIYLSYSGQDNFKTCCNWLLVIDWTGKPIAKYKLPVSFCHFSLIGVNGGSVFYTIDEDTGDLLFASFTI
jgi:hypothetical protein